MKRIVLKEHHPRKVLTQWWLSLDVFSYSLIFLSYECKTVGGDVQEQNKTIKWTLKNRKKKNGVRDWSQEEIIYWMAKEILAQTTLRRRFQNNYEFMRSTVCNSLCNRARCRGPVALLVRRPSGWVQYLFQEVDDIWCTGSNSCDRPFPKHPSAQHSRRSFRRWHTSDWH